MKLEKLENLYKIIITASAEINADAVIFLYKFRHNKNILKKLI